MGANLMAEEGPNKHLHLMSSVQSDLCVMNHILFEAMKLEEDKKEDKEEDKEEEADAKDKKQKKRKGQQDIIDLQIVKKTRTCRAVDGCDHALMWTKCADGALGSSHTQTRNRTIHSNGAGSGLRHPSERAAGTCRTSSG
jgi:hypothetical protein